MFGAFGSIDTFAKKSLVATLLGGAALSAGYYVFSRRKENSTPTVDPYQTKIYNLKAEQARIRSQVVSNTKYQVKLNLQRGTQYWGYVCVTFDCSDPSENLWLDFNAHEILESKVNAQNIRLSWSNSKLYLKNLRKGQNTVEIRFRREYSNDGNGLHRFVDSEDGEEYLYTQCEPFACHMIFPCFDQPDIKAEFALEVLAPSDWEVIANEPLMSKQQLGPDLEEVFKKGNTQNTLHHKFCPTLKISTYLFAVCAGKYYKYTCEQNEVKIPLQFFCRDSLKKYFNPENYLLWTIEGFKFYQNYFGIEYPFRKYDQVFVPEFNFGAMENVGCVTYREHFLFKDGATQFDLCRGAEVFLHEMAHMWFGNLVTMKWWEDLWLNESFATFLSHLAVEKSEKLNKLYPENWSKFLRRKGGAYALDQMSTTHPISTVVKDTSEAVSNFDAISYGKGASVLKQLHFLIGNEVYKQGTRRYLENHKFGNAEFADFIGALAQEANKSHIEIDLQSWSNDWIKTSGLNSLTPSFTVENGKVTSFKVQQSVLGGSNNKVRRHKTVLGLFDSSMKPIKEEVIDVEANQETEIFKLVDTPSPSCVVLNVHDYDYAKVKLDRTSIEKLFADLHKIEPPFTRQVVWRNLWDMVKDNEMSGVEFAEMAITQLPLEKQVDLTLYILEFAQSAIFRKVTKTQNKENFCQRIFASILEKMKADPQAIDLRSMLFSFMYHPEDVQFAVGWLENSTGVQNFELSQGERWKILKAYSSLDLNAEQLVNLEKEKDRSDTAQLADLYCQAVYPSAEKKAQMWQRLTNQGAQMSRYERQSAMSGFFKKRQKDILKEFENAYFEELPKVMSQSEPGFAKDFCGSLFPVTMKKSELVSKLQEFIPRVPSEHFLIKRILSEKLEVLKEDSTAKELSKKYLTSKSQ